MKVILIKDVQNLGNVGEVKEVADGYARNFLIPGGYVELATETAMKQAEKLRIEKEKRAEEELKEAEELADKLEGIAVAIKAKADESGKLYSAVKSEEISKALSGKGFDVDKDKIIIAEPIKETGDYEVVINLSHGLEVKVGIVVESDK
jgi:large subunit ribosomal protein L9